MICSLELLKIASASVPVRLFVPKLRNFQAFKLPNEVGMEPTRLFVPRWISSSFDKLPISLGMLPLNLLNDSDRNRSSPHKDRVVGS